MSTDPTIASLLGDDAATALFDWAGREELAINLPADPWYTTGYTNAALAMIYVTEPGTGSRLVVVKRLPPEQAAEPQAHRRALKDCPEPFRPHLVEQIYPPLRTPGGQTLMFQAQAGTSRAWRAMADLPSSTLPAACATLTRALIADWNPDARVRTQRAVDYLRDEVKLAHSLGRQTGGAGVLRTAPWVCTDEDAPMPNPLLLHADGSMLGGLRIDLIEGRGHSDLHGQNVLLRQDAAGADPATFVLVDLMTYRSRCPIDRDPVTLLLSGLARLLDDPSDRQRRLVLDVVVDPRHAARDEVAPVLTATIDAVYESADELLRHCGREAWHRQYLLSLIAHGSVFSTFENLGRIRRWWFYRLAGYAARTLVRDLDIAPFPDRVPLLTNPFPSAAAPVVTARTMVAASTGAEPLALRGRGMLSSRQIRGFDRGFDEAGGAQVSYPGPVKVEVCRALYHDWPDVADYLGIPAHAKARFKPGWEAADLWDWLQQRSRLDELAPALRALDFAKLADLLDRNANT